VTWTVGQGNTPDVSYVTIYIYPDPEPTPEPTPRPTDPPGPDPTPEPNIKPSARIIGPAGDPYFRYVLNNRKSDRAVAFRISPWGKKVIVPSGCIFRTGWHYERPFANLEVRRGNGGRLAQRNAGPGGYYGPLYKGFKRGWDCPR
jgi:hypothetical protein